MAFVLPILEVTDGIFGQPEFSPSELLRALVTLSDCDNGQADLDGKDGQLSMKLARLTGPGGPTASNESPPKKSKAIRLMGCCCHRHTLAGVDSAQKEGAGPNRQCRLAHFDQPLPETLSN
jgi:hypothetical protein